MRAFVVLLLGVFVMLSNACSSAVRNDLAFSPSTNQWELSPVDHRQNVKADAFVKSDSVAGEWTTDVIQSPLIYDELIYSWEVQVPENEGFFLYVKPTFKDGYDAPWLFAGYWGDVPKFKEEYKAPEFERGKLYIDQLIVTTKATGYQWKIVDKGTQKLSVLPKLHVVATNNTPDQQSYDMFQPVYTMRMYPQRVLDLPLRKQQTSAGERMVDTCQTAALATSIDYFGGEVKNEDLFEYTYDEAYQYKGVWPRVTGAASQFGYRARIDRFRDWQAVKAAISNNLVILASLTMPEDGDYIAPPYPNIGGHIFAINGLTDDGRVIVTDSALGKNEEGYRSQWLIQDLEQVWMINKGGVALVIFSPDGFEAPLVEEVAEFPRAIPGR